jgi:hypothetical protein
MIKRIENMEYIEWKKVLSYLVLLELVVSIAMLLVGHITGNVYFQGVGIGLLIAWVTGGLVYLINSKRENVKK